MISCYNHYKLNIMFSIPMADLGKGASFYGYQKMQKEEKPAGQIPLPSPLTRGLNLLLHTGKNNPLS